MLKANEAARWIVVALGPGEAYGRQIQDAVKVARDHTLSLATLYSTLYRLERDGLVKGRWGDEGDERLAELAERHGARRRYYRLTPAGESHLKQILG
jgi:PadR family transcriptional regulator PadR